MILGHRSDIEAPKTLTLHILVVTFLFFRIHVIHIQYVLAGYVNKRLLINKATVLVHFCLFQLKLVSSF